MHFWSRGKANYSQSEIDNYKELIRFYFFSNLDIAFLSYPVSIKVIN